MNDRLKRVAKLGWIPLEKMRVREEISQRRFDPAWANAIAREFKLEDFGTPTVNRVGEWYWIVDGQHRVAALKQWLGEWKGQTVECWCYHDLSEQNEADLFLALSRTKSINTFDKFRIALTAGHEEATNIDAIVRLKRLKVSRQKGPGAIACVSTLAQIYRRGADCLATTLDISFQAFGDAGLDADILSGIGQLPSRYNGLLNPKAAIEALGAVRGGAPALRARAETIRAQMGQQRTHCIAAAAVEYINRGKGGKKLPSWWKITAEPAVER